MLSNVLEVLAVLNQDVGKAGNRPADVDDGKMMMANWEQRSCQVFVLVRFSYQLQHVRPAGTVLLSQKLKMRKMQN